MENNGSKILFKLNGVISGEINSECPSAEDISVLIDGTIGKEQKEKLQIHISACEICYETYLAALEMTESSEKRRFRIFSPMSVAASIFIVLVAFVIFFKVNIGVKDIEESDSGFVKGPVLIKEGTGEHKADKQKIALPVKQKVSKKRGKKGPVIPPAPGKTARIKKSEEITREAEVPEVKDEPPGIKSKMVLRNTQGISQSGNEPARTSVGLSAVTVDIEKVSSDDKSGRQSVVRKKVGKGLVDKLKESEEKDRDIVAGMNCFSREGDEYKRRREFITKIPLRDTFPKIVKLVQPENFKADEPVTEPVYIILEVITNKTGDVVKVCLVSGNTGNIVYIVKAVKKWKFKLQGDSPARFRLALGISGNRIIEVLDQK